MNTMMKMTRSHEHIIIALGKVLEEEDLSNPYSENEMMRLVMKRLRGTANPGIVKTYIDAIMADRY